LDQPALGGGDEGIGEAGLLQVVKDLGGAVDEIDLTGGVLVAKPEWLPTIA
jgi:hypothetical protein